MIITNADRELASSITRNASKQTFYTIRFLADRERVAEAYRAYAYFRWVDDAIDAETNSKAERMIFVNRQKSLLEDCYHGVAPRAACAEEQMLVELIRRDRDQNSGLQIFVRNMMAVMAFDAERRARLVTQAELNEYTRWLASAVTEAMHHFIGHASYAPRDDTRYLAVSAAHITHMLRDTFDDLRLGYWNIPREVVEAHHLAPDAVTSDAYRAWVKSRVQLARRYFQAGKDYLQRVANARCRLAGFAYAARFEWLLDTFEREGFVLRPQYDERKSLGAGWRMAGQILTSALHRHRSDASPRALPLPEHSLKSR